MCGTNNLIWIFFKDQLQHVGIFVDLLTEEVDVLFAAVHPLSKGVGKLCFLGGSVPSEPVLGQCVASQLQLNSSKLEKACCRDIR